MQQNDKLTCRIVNYFPRERKFEVEDVNSSLKGYVIFTTHYHDIPIMKEAHKAGREITLYFDRFEGDYALFSYREIKSKIEITALFSGKDRDYNLSLFQALHAAIGSVIDTDEKYCLAKQLLAANRELKLQAGLAKDFFTNSTAVYQQRFWEEGVLPYFSNFGIKRLWAEGDFETKEKILHRLGITALPQSDSVNNIDCYFDAIEQEVEKNILSAQKSIKIAMAWFTNYDIFKALKEKLQSSRVEIVLVTNNDLINNGGYCLDLNELIQEGLKVYLYDYPEMIHHKFCIIDDELVMTGSYNWTFFSEAINRENMLVIRGNERVIQDYTKEFQGLINERVPIDRMPDSVPERPEYDRSSYKQYISEELIERTRRRIGDIRENIRRAKTLSPTYTSVGKFIEDLHDDEGGDNTGISIQELESVATAAAIDDRLEIITAHKKHLQELDTRREDILVQQQTVRQQQDEIQVLSQRIADDEDISEEERKDRQDELSHQEAQLHEEEQSLTISLNEVEQKSSELEHAVQQKQDEIAVIQETSQTETLGGRGSLKINLKWNTTDDLDLHVFDPNGSEIYYGAKEQVCNGVKGHLDVDANAGSPPYTITPQENICWDEGKDAPLGRYKVQVVLYSKRDQVSPVPFTVTVYPGKGSTKTFTGKIEDGRVPIDIVEFEYTESGISYLTD